MSESKAAEIAAGTATPIRAMTRTIGAFTGSASAISERLQPVGRRTVLVFQEAGSLIGAFLTPLAVLALSFGLWRLSADLGWTANFPIERGPFAHWMVWIPVAVGLKLTGSLINRPVPAETSTESGEEKAG